MEKIRSKEKEKENFSIFVQNMETEANPRGGTNTEEQNFAEDVISQKIRDEAILAWNLGKQIGISSSESDANVVTSLARICTEFGHGKKEMEKKKEFPQ